MRPPCSAPSRSGTSAWWSSWPWGSVAATRRARAGAIGARRARMPSPGRPRRRPRHARMRRPAWATASSAAAWRSWPGRVRSLVDAFARERLEVADDLPGLLIGEHRRAVVLLGVLPRRHAGARHAVADPVEDLTLRVLRDVQLQVHRM